MGKKSVLIAGSGPSLDTADWDYLPTIRIGINTAVLKVPHAQFVCCLDKQMFQMNELFINKICITTEVALNRARLHDIKVPEYVITVPSCMYSIEAAILHAANINVGKIVFVGCEGTAERAEGLQQYYTRHDDFYKEKYRLHRERIDALLEHYNIEGEFIGVL